MTAMIPRGKAAKLAAVLMLVLLVALPVSSAYLDETVDMTEYVEERSCYCHGADPAIGVDIVVDVPDKVAYTPGNDTVRVGIGILGEPHNLTGFGLFLNASQSDDGVKWTKNFSNDTVDHRDAVVRGIIRVNETSLWTVGKVTSKWFNVSFIPGQTDQDIVLSVTGMRANDNQNETGDYWNVAELTIKVRKQRLVNLVVGVTNDEEISVNEVTVDFYIDGEYLGNGKTEHIQPHASQNATIQWDVTFKKDGKYKLRAVVDPEGLVTETRKDNNEVTRDIWLGGPPEERDLQIYYGLGSMAVGAVIIVAVFWFWRRRQYRF